MQASTSQNVKQRKLREREIQKAEKKWFKNYGSRYQQQRHTSMKKIAPSVEIKPSWQVVRSLNNNICHKYIFPVFMWKYYLTLNMETNSLEGRIQELLKGIASWGSSMCC